MAQRPYGRYMHPSGPNPFDMKPEPEQKLPSLDDYIKKTSLNFSASSSSSKQMESANPFLVSDVESQNNKMMCNEFERIPRDPKGSSSDSKPPVNPMRYEANPVGMPLLIARKDDIPKQKESGDNEFSQMFSRDRGPATFDDTQDSTNYAMDDDFEDAEVIDYGAADNSMDDMDFPRGENPDANNNDDDEDPDFSLEDSEVIDYSQMQQGDAGFGHYSGLWMTCPTKLSDIFLINWNCLFCSMQKMIVMGDIQRNLNLVHHFMVVRLVEVGDVVTPANLGVVATLGECHKASNRLVEEMPLPTSRTICGAVVLEEVWEEANVDRYPISRNGSSMTKEIHINSSSVYHQFREIIQTL